MRKWWQGSLFYLVILIAIIALAFSFLSTSKGPEEVSFNELVKQANNGEIDTIQQEGDILSGLLKGKEIIRTSFVGSTKELMDVLKAAGVALDDGKVSLDVKTGGFV